MAQHIDAKPEELRGSADRYMKASENIESVIGDLDTEKGFLLDSWKGAAQEAFVSQYEELRPSFVQMKELAAQISEQLRQSANAIEENDANIASRIRG
ncbi:WXG100 family type VII secretion target [Bacillus sp. FSL W7-1360]